MFETTNRRTFLNRATVGIGALALQRQLLGEVDSGIKLAGSPKAKRVIFLCMAGGPSHLETLDYKPTLAKMHGEAMPESITKGQPIAQLQGRELRCLGPQWDFIKQGQSGQEISSQLPFIGKMADDIAIIRSMTTKQINHDPAHTFMNCGTQISGRPCMGSWIQYGLGSATNDLPGFVVLTSVGGGQSQPIASRQWHSGFLPSKYQGVHFHSKGDPVLYVGNPKGVGRSDQRQVIDAVNELNRIRNGVVDDPEIATKISQYEMAFRMQSSIPEVTDFKDEPEHIYKMYGEDAKTPGTYAANCLLARRLCERGVRFIQLYHQGWDQHGQLPEKLPIQTKETDQASAALVMDLKQRGLLEDTIVVWGGEFGRTNYCQGHYNPKSFGRDHHPLCFSTWVAGGGFKGGVTHGETDDYCYNIVKDQVHVHDFHATLLNQLGVDHEQLTFKYQGRYFRLTDVHGHVVKNIVKS